MRGFLSSGRSRAAAAHKILVANRQMLPDQASDNELGDAQLDTLNKDGDPQSQDHLFEQ
jgi:hypothetical protein